MLDNTVERLVIAEKRMASITRYMPDSMELARYRDVIIPDLIANLTKAEQKEYASIKAGLTPEQIKAKDAADIRAMEANKDKPSI